MGQALQFVAALAGLVLLVPALVLLATGSRAQAMRSLRSYGGMLGVLAAICGAGALVGVLAGIF